MPYSRLQYFPGITRNTLKYTSPFWSFGKSKNRSRSSSNNNTCNKFIKTQERFFCAFFRWFIYHSYYKLGVSIWICRHENRIFGREITKSPNSITAFTWEKSIFSGRSIFLLNFPQKHSSFFISIA